ncbi:MAG: hypothetical protein JWN04_4499 [Myxococcaceae bacterium]|nr:hypothetical protein [Myxococcaceae bacterium]
MAVVALGGILAQPAAAAARANGLAVSDCTGCHVAGKAVTVTITPDLSTVELGQTVRLTVAIQALNGSKGGVYFQATPSVGKVALVSGEPMKLSGDNGVTHSSPKTSSNGFVRFAIDWTAPTQPGSVEFHAYGLSANGDNTPDGDGAGVGYLSDVFGCTGSKYYQDNDGDGHGSSDSAPRLSCAPIALYATSNDDCNDSLETTYPGAPELCNKVDDNCDGQADEGLLIATYCEDKDGDGHGVQSSKTAVGCGPSKGFGSCDGDCNDSDATIHPSAMELCNFKDDNCNGQVDENAHASCGTGWCRRSTQSCSSAALCEPGPPRSEQCNALDDDCDGVVDNGSALCTGGLSCVNGSCGGVATSSNSDGGVSASRSDAGSAHVLEGGTAATPDSSDNHVESSGCAVSARGEHDREGGSILFWLSTALALARRSRPAPWRRQRRWYSRK